MAQKIIIIGAGIAGLSAGLHAKANGFDAEIYEAHTIPGGLCTSWKRGKYLFDGCIHWLTGSSGRDNLGKYLVEVGVLQGRSFIHHDEINRFQIGTGDNTQWFIVYTDPQRLNAHMKKISPTDGEEIDNFTRLINKFKTFPSAIDKPAELWGMGDFLSMMKGMKPFMKEYQQYGKLSVEEYAERFKSPLLQEAIPHILNMSNFSFFALLMMMAWHADKNAGYPVGGSLAFAQSMEKAFLSSGGIIHYGKRVTKIITSKGKACGIITEDGTQHSADIVIGAADGEKTIFGMLEGKFVSNKIKRIYQETPLFNSMFQVNLGVKRDFSAEPPLAVYQLQESVSLQNKSYTELGIRHLCYDPSMAPAGCSVLQIIYPGDYDYWKQLSTTPASYRAEKEKATEHLLAALETVYPGIQSDIETIDTATPVTWERYTANRRGTIEGWFINPKTMMLRVPKTLPGLKNFYMVGQWVQPGGGITSSIKSGRDAIQVICKKTRQVFTPANVGSQNIQQ
ncbi:MAG: NAD(P)/FAD-dependent oxidoreductase [Spirochaetales bacterium]|nr:NAD(P)/FAD-dependent oxidoreductase [Spirochaetales bacterium]